MKEHKPTEMELAGEFALALDAAAEAGKALVEEIEHVCIFHRVIEVCRDTADFIRGVLLRYAAHEAEHEMEGCDGC